MVSDQVVNLAPNGTEDGKSWLVPDMASWCATAELLEIPTGHVRRHIIDQARYLNNAIQGRATKITDLFTRKVGTFYMTESWIEDDT